MVAKKREPQTEQLGAEIEQMEAELRKLEEARPLRKAQIEGLEAEQRTYVVAARVQKDPAAQSNIERIAGEIAKHRMDDLFDGDAIAEISATLETKKGVLRREQWKERCGPLREKLESRATGELEAQAWKLAQDLKLKLTEINESDAEIVGKLRSIHPLLYRLAPEVDAARTRRQNIIAYSLGLATGTPVHEEEICEPAVSAFKSVLQKLEGVMQTDPAGQELRYVVLLQATPYEGVLQPRYSMLGMPPAEADKWVGSGRAKFAVAGELRHAGIEP